MKYVKKRLFLPLILAILGLTFIATSVSFAQTVNYDVTISPIFFDLTANPGDTINDKIRIRNNTDSPIPLQLGVEKLTGDVNGNLVLKKGSNDQTLSWIKFSSDKIVIKPLEWTEIPFTLQIPKDAAYGYYWTITFAQDNNSPLAKTGVSITGAAGLPVLLNVKKEGAKAEAKLSEFSVNNSILEYLPANFTIKISNTGNIHIKPHGNIFINDGGSKNLAILDVNSDLGNIIPGTNRVFNASWDDGFIVKKPVLQEGQPKIDKNGKPVEELTINWNKLTSFRIGKYTANLVLVFDDGTRDVPLEANISFWVIPYTAIGFIVISVVLFVLLLRFILKFYINREIRKRVKTNQTS